jgi:hypothetical protein
MKFVSLRTKRTHRRGKLHKPAGATLKRFTKSMVMIASISLAVMLLAAFTGCMSNMTPDQRQAALGAAIAVNDAVARTSENLAAQRRYDNATLNAPGTLNNPIYVTTPYQFQPNPIPNFNAIPNPAIGY